MTTPDLAPTGGMSPLGLCLLPEPALNRARTISYPNYIYEILHHAGLFYTEVAPDDLAQALPALRILVTVGEEALPQAAQTALPGWVADGGVWISVGGVGGLAPLFGVTVEAATYQSFGGGSSTLGEGYLQPRQETHPILRDLEIPLHFFNGLPIQATDAQVVAEVLDAHQRATARSGLTERTVGKGRCLLIAPDVPGTVVRIQQGIGITRDGVSAPDGSAPVGDQVLKSGDGGVLDWIFDRQPVPGAPGLQAFLVPVADLWREILLRTIFYAAESHEVPLPLLWLYPDNLPALAHMSHDTDQCQEENGWKMLEVVEDLDLQTTWCVILPGYPPALMQGIADAGHELAMHYDSFSPNRVWGEVEFDRQWRALTELFGGKAPVSNKNHYLRWEGDIELFEWCARRGIELDQSKGASKTGEAGFNFGSCHPYLPVAFDGRPIDVLELPTPTQDLLVFGPEELLPPLLESVYRRHGILHLLFHPSHILKTGVAEALGHSVSAARQAGLTWWTAAAINRWERQRRQLHWLTYQVQADDIQITLQATEKLAGATILWIGASVDDRVVKGKIQDEEHSVQRVERWGFSFLSMTGDLSGRQTLCLSIGQESPGV